MPIPSCAALFDRATSLESKSEAVLFRYAVYLDEASTHVLGCATGWIELAPSFSQRAVCVTPPTPLLSTAALRS